MIKRVLVIAIAAGALMSFAAWAGDAVKDTTAAKVAKGEYVGAKKCMMCHMKIYKAWSEVKHAHAFEALVAATPEQIAKMNALLKTDVKGKPESDPACLKCHVTGYQEPGGYPAADSLKNVSLAAVGCEMCHGPGSRHLAVPMSDKAGRRAAILKPTAETCTKCHTDAIAPKFDFAEMSKKVHPVAAAVPAK
jgi:hypothetical protein